jgi:hypothetical protein
MQKNPNPQGKGLVPVMDSLAQSRASVILPPKHIDQISNELFTSLFILHSHFQFKPVVNRSYWLYRQQNTFKLSLISPREWGSSSFGQYIGECVLQQDITWSLLLDDIAAKDTAFLSYIEAQRQEFDTMLEKADVIDDVLPTYVETLPFYQRLLASALANSLKNSMQKSGIQGLRYHEAKGLLTHF